MNKGLESLIEEVKKDCEKGQGCFNINGCDHEFTRMVDQDNLSLFKMGVEKKCVKVSKCFHKYCDHLAWILKRADEYAKFAGTNRDAILKAWEEDRTYWYMNYYQESNQPDPSDGDVIWIENFRDELTRKFGPSELDWKFRCPVCGIVQSGRDFQEIGEDPNNAYRNCIGRYKKGIGCNYSLGGLLVLSKKRVLTENFRIVPVFEVASVN